MAINSSALPVTALLPLFSIALKLFEDLDLSGGAVPLGDPLLLPAARDSGGLTSRLDSGKASEELFRY